MTTLPDIDTSNVSFIGYWNAIDQGGAETISPSDVTGNGDVQSYQLYDNGVSGIIALPNNGAEAHFRVKTDGWIVVWLDREHNFNKGVQNRDKVRGWWSLVADWDSNNPKVASNALVGAIDSLRQSLSANTVLADSDVGLYSYEYSKATTITALGISVDGYDSDLFQQAKFSYTSSTTRSAQVLLASTKKEGRVKDFGGNIIVDNGNEDIDVYGNTDVLANGNTPNPDTVYSHEVAFTGRLNSATGIASNVVVWY